MGKPLLLLCACLLASPAAAHSRLADVEVYDRTAGRVLTLHRHEGRRYVVGEPGHEYEITIRSRDGRRLLAVTSVDGVNVVTGETADPAQSGYVLDPHGSVRIAGWRKSLAEVAAFYFTRHGNSYAARTGRPFDVGVIGIALFQEKRRCCDGGILGDADRRADPTGPPAAAERHAESPAAQSLQRDEGLGTGHGRRERSAARHTDFERATDAPVEIIAIQYDTRANLVAQGVLPREREYAERRPRPFPGAFVPDP